MHFLMSVLALGRELSAGFLGDIVRGSYELLQPTLAMAIPAVAIALAHRFIRNKEAAELVVTGAGYAYNHLGSLYAANGKLDLEVARREAVRFGSQAIADLVRGQLAKLSSEQLATAVDGALGKLLASDPSFKVLGTVPMVAGVTNIQAAPPALVQADLALLGAQLKDAVREAVVTGIAQTVPARGRAVMRDLLLTGFRGTAVRIGPADVAAAAARIGCEVAVIQAVLDVESSGSGFDDSGRPKILFEPHIFYRQLRGQAGTLVMAEKFGLAYAQQGSRPYPRTSEGNYLILKQAMALDPEAALKSASWGIAQVMGFNFAVGGYADVGEMVAACMASEALQFGLLLGYVETNHLVDALRQKDWRHFAAGYNGQGAVEAYSGKLQAAYAHHAGPRPLARAAGPGRVQLVTPQAVIVTRPAPPAFDGAAASSDSLNDREWLRIRGGL